MATVSASGLYSNQLTTVFWAEGTMVPDEDFASYALVKPVASAHDEALLNMQTAYPGAYAAYIAAGGTPPVDPEAPGGDPEAPLGMAPLAAGPVGAAPPEVYDATDAALGVAPAPEAINERVVRDKLAIEAGSIFEEDDALTATDEYDEETATQVGSAEEAKANAEQRGTDHAPENRAEPFAPENRAGAAPNRRRVKKAGSAEAKLEGGA